MEGSGKDGENRGPKGHKMGKGQGNPLFEPVPNDQERAFGEKFSPENTPSESLAKEP